MITVIGEGVPRNALHKIEPVVPANAGKRWRPIPHGELADTVRDEVLTRGWDIARETYTTARSGADMAGALLLTGVKGLPALPGMTLALGMLHSNARRKALVLTVGVEVTCCCNGMCTGTVIMKRVHDHTVDLPTEIEIAVDRYLVAAKGVAGMVEGLRNAFLTDNQASEILMEAGRRGLVGWAAVGRVDKEYRNPTFKEHGMRTSWALLNAFTYAARKNIAPTRQMETYNAFRELLPTALLEAA